MKHACWAALVVVVGASAARGDAADLEKAVQEAIRKAEPGIACVLVSRSPEYLKLEGRPRRAEPGQLGTFPRIRDSGLGPPDSRKKYDMANPDYVPESYGSGIAVDKDGLVLTCAHV